VGGAGVNEIVKLQRFGQVGLAPDLTGDLQVNEIQRLPCAVDEFGAEGRVAGSAGGQQAQRAIRTVRRPETDLPAGGLVAVSRSEADANAGRGVRQAVPAGEAGKTQPAVIPAG